MKAKTSIEEILNSELLNSMIEQEDKDLAEADWTIEEARSFARFLINNQ